MLLLPVLLLDHLHLHRCCTRIMVVLKSVLRWVLPCACRMQCMLKHEHVECRAIILVRGMMQECLHQASQGTAEGAQQEEHLREKEIYYRG